eukprot:scaffold44182_cov57-Phaeocystis_antarctica.AAC.1
MQRPEPRRHGAAVVLSLPRDAREADPFDGGHARCDDALLLRVTRQPEANQNYDAACEARDEEAEDARPQVQRDEADEDREGPAAQKALAAHGHRPRDEHRQLVAELGIVAHHDVEEEAADAHHEQRPPAALHLPHRAAAVVEPDGRGDAVDERSEAVVELGGHRVRDVLALAERVQRVDRAPEVREGRVAWVVSEERDVHFGNVVRARPAARRAAAGGKRTTTDAQGHEQAGKRTRDASDDTRERDTFHACWSVQAHGANSVAPPCCHHS